MAAVPRQSWLGPAAGLCGVVRHLSRLRSRWVQFTAKPGGACFWFSRVRPCQSFLRFLCVQFPANPGWGLLLALVAWSLPNLG